MTPDQLTALDATVTQADREAAVMLFNDALGDMGSYAEYMRPSYREGAIRTIAEAFAHHRIAALRAQQPIGDVEGLVERKQFPILGSNGAKIDWQLVADHGKQAKANHYQTVERLAERGGLSWCELHAVLHNRPWQKMDENTAINECRKVEAEYLNAATLTTLSRRVEELEVENARMREAVQHYEAALLAAQPHGSRGVIYDEWNAARAALGGSTDDKA